MTAIRRLVVDVLKPHEPSLDAFAEHVAAMESVEGATVTLVERDTEVQNVKVTVEGAALDVEAIEAGIDALGASLHSIDQVAAGEIIVEDRPTLQDP